MSGRTFKILTFGCKLNQYESQVIRECLLNEGLRETEDNPDFFILNTCAVTKRAEAKVKKTLNSVKKKYSSRVIFCGCLVDMESRRIKENLRLKESGGTYPGVDMYLKNEEKYSIPEKLGLGKRCKEKINSFQGHSRAFVKVQDGCNNFCSYCIVPYLRGKSRSRLKEDILRDIESLRDSGYKEIVLSGICLGDYGKDSSGNDNLVNLLEEILDIQGFRIRLSSIEPKDITGDLLSLMKSNPRICRHLHLPFQSGDDKILERMQRPYSNRDYLEVVDNVRSSVDDVCITTDIMVGFPFEGEEQFKNTEVFIEKVSPLKVHIFTYSPREFTTACSFKVSSGSHTVRARKLKLQELTVKLSLTERKKFLGRSLEALRETPDEAITTNYIKVRLEEKVKAEGFLQVKITDVTSTYTKGIINNGRLRP